MWGCYWKPHGCWLSKLMNGTSESNPVWTSLASHLFLDAIERVGHCLEQPSRAIQLPEWSLLPCGSVCLITSIGETLIYMPNTWWGSVSEQEDRTFSVLLSVANRKWALTIKLCLLQQTEDHTGDCEHPGLSGRLHIAPWYVPRHHNHCSAIGAFIP